MAKGYFFYDFVWITGILPAKLFFRTKVVYQEGATKKTDGGVLMICNHNTFADPVMIMSTFTSRRVHFMATKDLFKPGLANWFFNHVHCIKVDKENFNMSSFKQVSEYLKKGKAVVIFPEGGVDVDSKELKTFKSGAALMALRNKVNILPLYIKPKSEDCKRNTLVIGKQIEVSKMIDGNNGVFSVDSLNLITQRLYECECELKELV